MYTYSKKINCGKNKIIFVFESHLNLIYRFCNFNLNRKRVSRL